MSEKTPVRIGTLAASIAPGHFGLEHLIQVLGHGFGPRVLQVISFDIRSQAAAGFEFS